MMVKQGVLGGGKDQEDLRPQGLVNKFKSGLIRVI